MDGDKNINQKYTIYMSVPFLVLYFIFFVLFLNLGPTKVEDSHEFQTIAHSLIYEGIYKSHMDVQSVPSSLRPPVQPVLVALGLKLKLKYESWIRILNLLILALFLLVSWTLLKIYCQEKYLLTASWLYVAVLAGTAEFWYIMFSGEAEPIYILLLLSTLLFVTQRGRIEIVGFLAAVAFLTRYVGLCIIPALFFSFNQGFKWLRFIKTYAIIIAPWLIFSWHVNPSSLFSRNVRFEFDSIYFFYNLKLGLANYFLFLPTFINKIYTFLAAILFVAAIIGLLMVNRRVGLNRFILVYIFFNVAIIFITSFFADPVTNLSNRQLYSIMVPLFLAGAIEVASCRAIIIKVVGFFLMLRIVTVFQWGFSEFNFYSDMRGASFHSDIQNLEEKSDIIFIASGIRGIFVVDERYRLLNLHKKSNFGEDRKKIINGAFEQLRERRKFHFYYVERVQERAWTEYDINHIHKINAALSLSEIIEARGDVRVSLVTKDSDWIVHRLEIPSK